MLIECCSQERTFLRYFGLVAARFCLMRGTYQGAFSEAFRAQYAATHRLETNPLRNTAKFFAHLLHSDALPWSVLEFVRLNEDETTPSSRIFVKVLFQELAEYMGLGKLRARLEEPVLTSTMEGIFPKENLRDTRFSINFFTSIGLGGLTDNLRAFLKHQSVLAQQAVVAAAAQM
jgi:pre-mRNA-splicing factor CWC22